MAWLIRGSVVMLTVLLLTRASVGGDASTLLNDHSLLPDFRYAGYHSGQDRIPNPQAIADVKNKGAKGDGTTDDTAAFRAAVKTAGFTDGGGAVNIPAGRYVITNVIELSSDVVLRGAGAGKTVLVIPKSLQDLGGVSTVEDEKSGYAFSGGFITISGKPKTTRVAPLAADAKRGDRTITLTSRGKLKMGDRIRVVTNNDPSLGRYLHGDRFDAGKATFDHKNFIDWVARIDAMKGNTLTLDRPLRIDLRTAWQPEVWSYEPGVENAGVENLTFEFAGRAKKEHLKEEGFNAIYFDGADNCWVRGVEFIDADNAVNVTRARFVTVENVTFKEAKRKSPSGHHAMWAREAQDCLFANFRFETQYVHDLSVEGFACGNVFENGHGVRINFDHHGNAPYENLFTQIDVGDVSRLWQSSGRSDRLPHSGVRSVIWGVTYDKGKLPKLPDWPQLIVVGVKGYASGKDDQTVEEAGGHVTPANLFEAQKQSKVP
jgi:hypothetical protein